MTSDHAAPTEMQFLGKYRLLARLGTGGMAEVLLGRLDGPAGFSKHFAIKRMRPELTTHREFVDLFLEEARTASLLSHANICQVNELNVEGGDYFMVLEYLDGIAVSSALIKSLADPRALPIPFMVGIIQQASEGLHYAHGVADEHGVPYTIVHRDISPPNLFITTGGVVKVLDFGISKSRESVVKTLTGQIRGKFAYMSPEQLRGEKLDQRSDVFSLAIVTFEILTGRRLFRRKTRLEVFKAIVREPIPAPIDVREDLPPRLSAVVERALARNRDERYDSAREFGDALAESIRDLGGPMQVPDVGDLVREKFPAELAAKRQLLTHPPGVQLSAPPLPGSGALGTQPTKRLLKPGETVPDARVGEIDTDDYINTANETNVWSRGEVTSIDLKQGDGDVIDDGSASGSDEPDGSREP
ncbi:MAG TPA: serine/threonine-protein kinase [Kofleriaceae bacterium]|nr:serine/threonine-protein kinase [Kofleriaceae bacterium]